MAKLPKRPRDTPQLAKFIVDVAAGKRPKDRRDEPQAWVTAAA